MTAALTVQNLTVYYEKTAVLWDVSLEIPKGKMVGIIGPNGAGKSTFLKALIGVIQPFSGTIAFFDQPYQKALSNIAYIPQRASIDWDFPITVFDVVLMGRYGKLGWFRRPKKADRGAALQALERVGMLSFKDRQISQLSGGQQQRVFIARALLQQASLYLMDEPMTGIDHASEKAFLKLFDELKAEGKTLLIVYHDLNNVTRYFDWTILLNTCLLGCGPTEEVFTSQNVEKAYGNSGILLEQITSLSKNQHSGASLY
jgi:manganese/zinc/iron transport system ATP- binding protein